MKICWTANLSAMQWPILVKERTKWQLQLFVVVFFYHGWSTRWNSQSSSGTAKKKKKKAQCSSICWLEASTFTKEFPYKIRQPLHSFHCWCAYTSVVCFSTIYHVHGVLSVERQHGGLIPFTIGTTYTILQLPKTFGSISFVCTILPSFLF